jgi:hypothetical protein
MWVSFHPLHRARSARKKGTWPLPSSFQACSFISQGWGLIDLPLRASNEALLRARFAREQKIISLHPLLCSVNPVINIHFTFYV